jgi:hypothetical protein
VLIFLSIQLSHCGTIATSEAPRSDRPAPPWTAKAGRPRPAVTHTWAWNRLRDSLLCFQIVSADVRRAAAHAFDVHAHPRGYLRRLALPRFPLFGPGRIRERSQITHGLFFSCIGYKVWTRFVSLASSPLLLLSTLVRLCQVRTNQDSSDFLFWLHRAALDQDESHCNQSLRNPLPLPPKAPVVTRQTAAEMPSTLAKQRKIAIVGSRSVGAAPFLHPLSPPPPQREIQVG